VIAADHPDRRSAKLFTIAANGSMLHLPRTELATQFKPGDVVIANDAATLPASLHGTHIASSEPIEVRLAAWVSVRDPSRFIAIAFGAGDHRTRTEDRPPPPPLSPGNHLSFGPLAAVVERLIDHPRLFALRFIGPRAVILAKLARYGRPIQYAHVPRPLDLWDVWTGIAADPIAFEPPSASFALDWRTLAAWRRRGIGFATLTIAAGISSTGDPALDLQLPFDEQYRIPERTVAAIKQAESEGGRVVAIGTSVVRGLESAADVDGSVSRRRCCERTHREWNSVARCRCDPHWRPPAWRKPLELLRAFADDAVLDQISKSLIEYGYRAHEFGDSMLLQRQPRATQHSSS
jgi:S-adenosylmethionine:tRNA ribosyltransferase-isomerase